jgi:di/tricarboxylate transporter
MAKTGAAEWVAQSILGIAHGLGPLGALIIIYCLCMMMAEMLHHTAAVAIMFPIAMALAGQVGADPRPFVIAIAIGSTCCFASPFAYQTHLIVYGAGNYRFKDFIRVGLPLNLICAGVALYAIPRIWSL